MKILLIHQYFKTPEEGSGIRSWYLAQAFQNAGHEVMILSGHDKLAGRHTVKGLNIHYFRIPYGNHFGFQKRIWAYFNYVIKCLIYLRKHHAYDFLYILSTPLTTGWIGLSAKNNYGINYAFEVGDLWPLAPIQMGAIKNKWLISRLYQFEERIYRNALLLAGLSKEISRAIGYTIDFEKNVEVISNMADCQFFQPIKNIPEKFTNKTPMIIGYQGAIGKANHIEYLLDLAEALKMAELPISIRIMGDGSEKKRLLAQSQAFENVSWVTPGGKAEVREELNNTHITYISYASVPVLETGCPNKLFDGLAAGKMIVINFKGWIHELIKEHECGVSYNCAKPTQAVDLLRRFVDSPLLLEAYQENARKLAEQKFDVPKVTITALEMIQK